MSSSKSLFEDVIWALSNRKLGPFKMPLKTGAKMNKYAKNDSSFSLLLALVKYKKTGGKFLRWNLPPVLFLYRFHTYGVSVDRLLLDNLHNLL